MNGTESHFDEGVAVGSCRINRLLFADDLVLLASSEQRLQHALDRFAAAYDRAGIKVSTKNTRVLSLSINPRQCVLQASDNTLQQVERLSNLTWYLRVTEGRTRRLLHGLVKQTQFCVLRALSLCGDKNGSFKHRKAAGFKSVFVPILTYGHGSWVMTERVLFQLQATEMGFLRRVHDVTLRDKVRSCEIRKALNVVTLLWIERSQLRWFGHVSRMPQERLARQVLLATPTEKRPRGRPRTRWCDYISNLA